MAEPKTNILPTKPDIVQSMTPSRPNPEDDALFGAAGEPIALGGNQPVVDPITANPDYNPNLNAPPPIVNQQQQQQQQEIPVDGRLTPEQVQQLVADKQGLQSKFDKQTAAFNKYQKDADVAMKFTQAFVEDPEVRMATIASYHPELLTPTNPLELAQKRVKEEFGETFIYDEASKIEQDVYSGRVQAVFEKLQNGGTNQVKTLKQLADERKSAARSRTLEIERVDKELMEVHKWTPEHIANYKKWYASTAYKDSAQVYAAMMNNLSVANEVIPNAAHLSGVGVSQNEDQAEMDEMFGTAQPNFLEQ